MGVGGWVCVGVGGWVCMGFLCQGGVGMRRSGWVGGYVWEWVGGWVCVGVGRWVCVGVVYQRGVGMCGSRWVGMCLSCIPARGGYVWE